MALPKPCPGPIFTLSSYLGAIIGWEASGDYTGVLLFSGAALLGIFMPSFGFVAGLLPFWHRLRTITACRQALQGINAAVVGLLLGGTLRSRMDQGRCVEAQPMAIALIVVSWLLLAVWKRQPGQSLCVQR